jgi:hypothetical protein
MDKVMILVIGCLGLYGIWAFFKWGEKLKSGTFAAKFFGVIVTIGFIIMMILGLGQASKDNNDYNCGSPDAPAPCSNDR